MKRPSRFLSLLAAACALIPSLPAIEPIQNENGLPAVWAAIHGITGPLDLNADPDGDGLTNREEAAAGTNPFSPNDVLQVSDITVDPGVIHLTFPTVSGKKYQPQVSASLSSPSWSNATPVSPAVFPLDGNDGHVTANISDPLTAPKFFRIVVSDADSDGDGVSDWEEGKLGMDPFSPSSDGVTGDQASANAAVAASSVVSITAVDTLATEPADAVTPASDLATFLISRTGGLRPITVPFTISGPAVEGTDYQTLSPHSVTLPLGIRSAIVTIVPKSDATVEGFEAVVLTIGSGTGYTLSGRTTAGVLIADFNNNTTPAGTGVFVEYRNEDSSGANSPSASVDPTVLFQKPIAATEQDVDFRGEWGSSSPAAGVNADDFTSRWTGEIMPQFSQTYTFAMTANDASRLWVNGQLLIDNFPHPPTYQPAISSSTISATIELVGGKRYPIRVDHFDDTSSAAMVLQWACVAMGTDGSGNPVVQDIPLSRLFNRVPPQFAGSTDFLAFVGTGTYSLNLKQGNGSGTGFGGNPTSFTASNLPSGWTVNASTGVISGVPSAGLVGQYDIPVSATNSYGTGSAIVHLTILQTGRAVTKDIWTTGAPFASLAVAPFDATPDSSATTTVTSLATSASAQINAMRLRGFISPPSTGVYKFWLGGDDDAELWISNSEEVNELWRRATLSSATTAGSWTNAATSDLLYLKAGLRYYFEVRSRNSSGTGFVRVGWLKPGETGTQPSQEVPDENLSPYSAPAPASSSGTLYVTSLAAQGSAVTKGTGSATLQLSEDETQAVIRFSYANMTGPLTQHHIHSDPWNNKPSTIIFDMDVVTPQPDGSYIWPIVGVSPYTAADIVQVIKEGAAYLNIHTAAYPAGEIRGNFTLATGSQTAPPLPPTNASLNPPTSAATDDEAARFLTQATFGPTTAEIAAVRATTYEAWIDQQLNLSPTYHFYPFVWDTRNQNNFGNGAFSGAGSQNVWWKNSITAPDQLRQKLAYALSQILVASRNGELDVRNDAIADYYDMMLDGAVGNFKDLLKNVSLHPAMGAYLDMLNNDKPDIRIGRIPNENYAREIMQLFSLGLYRMWPDGSLVLNSQNLPIPTYDQDVIVGLAHAFTGWTFDQAGNNGYLPNQTALGASFADTVVPSTSYANRAWVSNMKEVPNHHFTGEKRFLNNVVLPGLDTITVGGVSTQAPDPYVYVHQTSAIQSPEYQALPAQELEKTHDMIFQHPNVGPFVCRQLIQRFVTSSPSRDYVYRVVQKFNDNGSGVRGDLKAVVKAILLDYEARSATERDRRTFGKQREPILRVTSLARALAPAADGFSGPYSQDGGVILVKPTNVPHSLLSNTPVALTFTPGASGSVNQATDGIGLSNIGNYTVFNFTTAQGVATTDTVPSPSTSNTAGATVSVFPTRTKDCHRATFTWNSTGNTLTVTTASNHSLSVGNRAYLRFRTGTQPSNVAPVGGTSIDGLYAIATVPSSASFTVTGIANPAGLATPATNLDVHVLRAGYRQNGSGSTATMTIESYTRHGLTSGQWVWAAFGLPVTGTAAVDGFCKVTVVDENTFTLDVGAQGLQGVGGPYGVATIGVNFGANADGTDGTQSAKASAAMPVLNRTGTAVAAYSTWQVGVTDSDLAQSPLYSPTVFNFYLPDFQFPGSLAKAGLVTPEFQLTSETNVIRANNFIFNGVFRGNSNQFNSNDWSQAGFGGFQNYSGGITIDVGPWMGILNSGGTAGSNKYWTDGNGSAGTNLSALFDKLNTLLAAGQVPTAAKTTILSFVTNTSNIGYTTTGSGPTALQRRDRVRAIIHLIATSPDCVIQK